jgi:hypothetical protein
MKLIDSFLIVNIFVLLFSCQGSTTNPARRPDLSEEERKELRKAFGYPSDNPLEDQQKKKQDSLQRSLREVFKNQQLNSKSRLIVPESNKFTHQGSVLRNWQKLNSKDSISYKGTIVLRDSAKTNEVPLINLNDSMINSSGRAKPDSVH